MSVIRREIFRLSETLKKEGISEELIKGITEIMTQQDLEKGVGGQNSEPINRGGYNGFALEPNSVSQGGINADTVDENLEYNHVDDAAPENDKYQLAEYEEVLHNQFREDTIHNLAQKISKYLGYNAQPQYLGHGDNGFAYDLGDGKVLKITGSETEASESLRVKGKKYEHLADIYNVYQTDHEGTTLYIIVQEKIDTSQQDVIDRLTVETNNVFSKKMQKRLVDILEFYRQKTNLYELGFADKIDNLFDGASDDARKFYDDMLNIIDDVKKARLQTEDYFVTDNLGYKDGKLMFFDLGGRYDRPLGKKKPKTIDIDEGGDSLYMTQHGTQDEPWQEDDTMPMDEDVVSDKNKNRLAEMFTTYIIDYIERDGYKTILDSVDRYLKDYDSQKYFDITSSNPHQYEFPVIDELLVFGTLHEFNNDRWSRLNDEFKKYFGDVNIFLESRDQNYAGAYQPERKSLYIACLPARVDFKDMVAKYGKDGIKMDYERHKDEILYRYEHVLKVLLDKYKSTIIHELIHHLDYKQYNVKDYELQGTSELDKLLYYNHPLETNAKYFEIIQNLNMVGDPQTFKEFFKMLVDGNSKFAKFFEYLDEKKKKRLIGRAYKFYKEQEPMIKRKLAMLKKHGGDTSLKINERITTWMPKAKSVKVKKECMIGGKGDGTSKACDQGDISNLEISEINDDNVHRRKDNTTNVAEEQETNRYYFEQIINEELQKLEDGKYILDVKEDSFIHFTTESSANEILERGALINDDNSMFESIFAISLTYGEFVPNVQYTWVEKKLKPNEKVVALQFKTNDVPWVGFVEEVKWKLDRVNLIDPKIISPEQAISLIKSSPKNIGEMEHVTYK